MPRAAGDVSLRFKQAKTTGLHSMHSPSIRKNSSRLVLACHSDGSAGTMFSTSFTMAGGMYFWFPATLIQQQQLRGKYGFNKSYLWGKGGNHPDGFRRSTSWLCRDPSRKCQAPKPGTRRCQASMDGPATSSSIPVELASHKFFPRTISDPDPSPMPLLAS